MKKEEFPTFLNEQPTIIFGRTGRELLIIVCGLFLGFKIWADLSNLLPGSVGSPLGLLLAIIVAIAFLALALAEIGYRHLEEWIFIWLFFIAIPKVYLYKPQEDSIAYQAEVRNRGGRRSKPATDNDLEET